MMLLLLVHDGADCGTSLRIAAFEQLQLLLQVGENDSFDSDTGGGNGTAAEKPGDQAKDVAAQTAKQIAPAAPHTRCSSSERKISRCPSS